MSKATQRGGHDADGHGGGQYVQTLFKQYTGQPHLAQEVGQKCAAGASTHYNDIGIERLLGDGHLRALQEFNEHGEGGEAGAKRKQDATITGLRLTLLDDLLECEQYGRR